MVTRPKRSLWRDYGVALGLAVAVAFGIRAFGIEPYRIPSRAMSPALQPGETIFVAKWPFGLRLPFLDGTLTSGREPRRGEIVLFSQSTDSSRFYLKRVIALPGETVQIRNGRIWIDGRKLEVQQEAQSSCGIEKNLDDISYAVCWELPTIEAFGPEKVPENSVFVLGDMRSQAVPGTSITSESRGKPRGWGFVKQSELHGSALWIWMSIRPEIHGDGKTRLFPEFRWERMFRRVQ